MCIPLSLMKMRTALLPGRVGAKVFPRAGVVMALVTALAMVYWLWFGLFYRSYSHDEAINFLAVKGIVEHGVPRLPSGFLYSRGYLTNYMTAGVAYIFGLNTFSLMLPSLLMGIGSLWLTYLLARDILDRRWLGVLAAVVLLALHIQAFYATSPRMYMGLQFFTVLAVYSSWRGYIQGHTRFKWFAVLAIVAAMLTHVEGILLAVTLPPGILAILWWTKRECLTREFCFRSVVPLVFLGALAAFLLNYRPPDAFPAITAYSSLVPTTMGLNLHPRIWGEHIKHLEMAVPYGLTLIPIAAMLTMGPILWQRKCRRPGLLYLFLVVWATVFLLLLSTPRTGSRLFLLVLPLYSLIILSAGAFVVDYIMRYRRKVEREWSAYVVVVALLAGVVLPNLGFLLFERDPAFMDYYIGRVPSAFGISCDLDVECNRTIKQNYIELGRALAPEDRIISNDPQLTYFYLGKVDGFLARPSNYLTDEYLGIPLIDTSDEVLGLSDGQQRVWVIIVASPSSVGLDKWPHIELLDREYHRVSSSKYLTTYVNRVEADGIQR